MEDTEKVTAVPMLQTYRSVVLTNSKNEKYEITSAVAEINIYEDLYSNVLTGSILYLDDHGGLSSLKISGNEKLTIELYKSDKGDEVSSHDFIIYSISKSDRIKDGVSTHIINFSSFEIEVDKNIRCYSAIDGSCAQAIKKLYLYLNTQKALEVEDTMGSYKFVMPSMTPLECINWYAGRSISSESKGSYFLFYETLQDGFKYSCIDTLVGKSPKFNYRYEPAGGSLLGKDVTNIREYEVLQVLNSLDGIDEQYTTLWNSDTIRKKIVKQVFDYDQNKRSTLNDGDSLASSSDKNGFDFSFTNTRRAYGTKPIVRNENRNTHTQTQNYYYDSLQPKLSAIRQYNALKIRMHLFGNRDLQVGKTLNLDFNKSKMIDSENKDESRDDIISGKFLITAIRYIYKMNSFDMSVEVVKDSKSK